MLYLILIVGLTLVIALVNILCGAFGLAWWYLLLASIIATITIILWDGLLAWLTRKMPKKWFNHEKKIYQVSKREVNIYKHLGIKYWKEKVPELGGFTNFHKNHVAEPNNPEYIERYLLEINYGWIGHVLGSFLGYMIIFLDYKMFMGNGITIGLTICIPVASVNFVLSLMPALVLRYNAPRLETMLKFARRKQKAKEDIKEEE